MSLGDELSWINPSDSVYYGIDKNDFTKHIIIQFDEKGMRTEIYSWLNGGLMAEHSSFPFPFPDVIS